MSKSACKCIKFFCVNFYYNYYIHICINVIHITFIINLLLSYSYYHESRDPHPLPFWLSNLHFSNLMS